MCVRFQNFVFEINGGVLFDSWLRTKSVVFNCLTDSISTGLYDLIELHERVSCYNGCRFAWEELVRRVADNRLLFVSIVLISTPRTPRNVITTILLGTGVNNIHLLGPMTIRASVYNIQTHATETRTNTVVFLIVVSEYRNCSRREYCWNHKRRKGSKIIRENNYDRKKQ